MLRAGVGRLAIAGVLVAALVATQHGCVTAPDLVSNAPISSLDRDCEVFQSERFSFHNDPWINLHHFLFEWARNVPERPTGDRRRPVDVTELTGLASLTPADQRAWQNAVDFYRERLIKSDLTFDRTLIALR